VVIGACKVITERGFRKVKGWMMYRCCVCGRPLVCWKGLLLKGSTEREGKEEKEREDG